MMSMNNNNKVNAAALFKNIYIYGYSFSLKIYFLSQHIKSYLFYFRRCHICDYIILYEKKIVQEYLLDIELKLKDITKIICILIIKNTMRKI